ncbi:MAG: class I adenylate-forming enzyme family protein [Clostridia bacterium]|nr:class I adenylate-forming enzyme family protein [Clostridia bacterium]
MITWNDFQEKGNNQILPNYKRNSNEPLFIAKTGGSTGKPKNVMLSDKCFNIQAHQHLNLPINYSMGDRWVRMWPLFSASMAVPASHLPLCYGMTQIIEPAFDVDKIDELILNYRPNHLIVISHCIDSLLQSEKLKGVDLSYIKTLGIGGESITAEYEEKIEQFMIEHNITPNMTYGYGMTENASGATSRFSAETSTVGGVGIPLVNTIIKIIDHDTEEELKYGEQGEICVLSSNHMLEYYNEPEKSKDVLRTHADGRVWLHSGDLGYMDENGQLFVKGRTKRMIMLFDGHKVYPLDLEELLETIPEISRAVVVTEKDPLHPSGVTPCAFVTLNSEISTEELRKKVDCIINENCEDFVKINSIYIKDELPKTAIGKVDIKMLEQMAKENSSKT